MQKERGRGEKKGCMNAIKNKGMSKEKEEMQSDDKGKKKKGIGKVLQEE